MSEPFIGEIRLWALDFAPKDFAFCDGSPLPISQHSALFAVIGCTYGGDGHTTFRLPDLRDRIPIGAGTGPGLRPRTWGETGGVDSVALTESNLPPHTHRLLVAPLPANATTPGPEVALARGDNIAPYSGQPADSTLAMETISKFTGGGQPHNNHMPSLALNFTIALIGVFPPHS